MIRVSGLRLVRTRPGWNLEMNLRIDTLTEVPTLLKLVVDKHAKTSE